jgi:hypothetical protein
VHHASHPRLTRAAACPIPRDRLPSHPHTKFHVLAAAGDLADELRSLGVHDAASARDALLCCLAHLDEDPVADHEAALRDPELADLLRREQQQLREALAEPDVSFVVAPVDAEAHFVRDHDGVVKDAGEVARRRARMRREWGGRCVDAAELAQSRRRPATAARRAASSQLCQYVASNTDRRYHDKRHE